LKFRNDNLLLIFTRNPELGKCKTRLADVTGPETALEIYKLLLGHTVQVTRDLPVYKRVYYSDAIWENDCWDDDVYDKRLQTGNNLGERMRNAFDQGFTDGFTSVIVIGSDLLDLTQKDLEEAFTQLHNADFVIGPARDGGYYLLGMHKATPRIFENKNWGNPSVLKDTLSDLRDEVVTLLELRNDIDTYEDIKNEPEFKSFLK
jgi:rSAM/selenodomain-associated transferase 1